MTRLLNALGLMTVREHERIVERKDDTIDTIRTLSEGRAVERNEALAKFKKAITDLAAHAEEIKNLRADLEEERQLSERFMRERDEWRHKAEADASDAGKFRAKAKADAERKRERRAAERDRA